MSNAHTVLPSEAAAVVARIDPDAQVAGAVTSDWADMREFSKMMAIILAGTLGTSATVDAKLQQATDSSGTGAKDIPGKAITQFTDAGGDSDKQAIINVDEHDLDIANGFNHVALVITVATATSDTGGVVLGFGSAKPASNRDLASMAEIV